MKTKTNFKIAPVAGDWVLLDGQPAKYLGLGNYGGHHFRKPSEPNAEFIEVDLSGCEPVNLTPDIMGWVDND